MPERDTSRDLGRRRREREARDPLERIVSWLSGALILAAAALLIAEGLGRTRPAAFTIDIGEIRVRGGAFHVPLRVRNTGDESAEDVAVRVTLEQADSVVAEARITLDWLPAGSVREAFVLFRRDPRNYRILAGVEGFVAP